MSPPSAEDKRRFLDLAVAEAIRGVSVGEGGPFGAVIVRGERVIAKAANAVIARNDPTAHAEIGAIRAACAAIGSFQLEGCDIYASCEPCPMCLGAILWARPRGLYYAATREDAAAAGFDDALFYRALRSSGLSGMIPWERVAHEKARAPFVMYAELPDKVRY